MNRRTIRLYTHLDINTSVYHHVDHYTLVKIAHLSDKIDTLRCESDETKARALSAEKRLQEALVSIGGLTEQIDHLTQLLAVSQKSIQQLTEQNQFLLEDTRQQKSSWWKRVFTRG